MNSRPLASFQRGRANGRWTVDSRRWMARRALALAVLVALVAIAAAWLPRLLVHPFHEDEAIYAAWSLQILRGDFWLSGTPVDKSPLTFYPVAASIALFGQHEWAARLPNLMWTGLILAALWRIGERQGRPGWFPLLLTLASPLVWALAASAFTDPAMLALALFALERGQTGRSGQAGSAFGLAFLAKPTALFLAPLLLLNLRRDSSRSGFILASAAPLLVAWAWDASRAAPSWWALGRNAYGTLGEAGAQAGEWASLMLVALGAIALIGVLVAASALRTPAGNGEKRSQTWRWSLALTLLLWVPAHLLLGFQPWERYLLPLVPVAALLVTDLLPLASNGAGLKRPVPLLAILVLLATLLAPASVGVARLEPHDGGWQGISEIGEAIEALPPGATVFYTDMGRPLAWYAADAEATLLWGGDDGAAVVGRLADYEGCPCYLATRLDEPLPALLRVGRSVRESANFRLIALDR
jgi:4-amino-4-deoxy-L-arabinose transferase-like glycosyltransferase